MGGYNYDYWGIHDKWRELMRGHMDERKAMVMMDGHTFNSIIISAKEETAKQQLTVNFTWD